MRRAAPLLVLAPLLLAGCPDTRPSAGRCSGTLAGVAIAAMPIDAEASYFFRDDDIFLDDDAPFTLSYGGGAVVFDGVFDDLPGDALLGTHDVASELFQSFSATTPDTPGFAGATMTLTTSRPDRVIGTLDASYVDGSALRCELDLRRAYERDTDD